MNETKFAPVNFDRDSDQSLRDIFFLGAWINTLHLESASAKEKITPPPEFKPKLLSYYDFSAINEDKKINQTDDNVLVVLMPEFNEDLKLLEMMLGQRYGARIKKNNITVKSHPEEILELKPNISGIGVDLKALWRKLFS